MCHDVIPLACSDWCILAASSALAGGGGVGIRRSRWGRGEFSTDRDIQMWTEPSVGVGSELGPIRHIPCSTVSVLVLMSWLPTVGQFWCFKGAHEQGIVVMVWLAVVWWRHDGGKRPGSDYARLLHLPSEFCYISRPREGGRESRDGRGYCEWKSKCCADSCGDVLRWTRRGATVLLSAGQLSLGALTALSYAVSGRLAYSCPKREAAFSQVWHCWFSCVFSYFEIFRHFSIILCFIYACKWWRERGQDSAAHQH